MAGQNGRAFAITAGQQVLEIGHDVTTLVLGGLMAALAVGLEKRADFAVVTDLRGGLGGLLFGGAGGGGRERR